MAQLWLLACEVQSCLRNVQTHTHVSESPAAALLQETTKQPVGTGGSRPSLLPVPDPWCRLAASAAQEVGQALQGSQALLLTVWLWVNHSPSLGLFPLLPGGGRRLLRQTQKGRSCWEGSLASSCLHSCGMGHAPWARRAPPLAAHGCRRPYLVLEEVNQPSEVKEIRNLGQGPRAAMGQRFRAKVTT